jgi:hypothetical protein
VTVVISIVAAFILLGSAANYALAYSYSSNMNVFVGLSSTSECSAVNAPYTYISFNSTVSTNDPSGDNYSVQMNAWSVPSNSNSINIMQFAILYNTSDDITATVQYYQSGGVHPIFKFSPIILHTTSLVSGDSILIDALANSTGIIEADFEVYHSGTYYHWDYDIPKVDIIPIVSWQLDIVGLQYKATFTSGGGSMNYDDASGSLMWSGTQPSSSCIEGHGIGTGESSNMGYDTPTTNVGEVFQDFEH